MFHATRHHKQFAWKENHITITQASLENEKEVIRVIMFVPDTFAPSFHHHHIVFIQSGDGSWGKVLREKRQLRKRG